MNCRMTFDEFLATDLEPLSRYARVLCGDHHSAHDLVADTLVAASRRWDKISRVDQPGLYVRRMLTNRHVDQVRRHLTFKRAQVHLREQLATPADATNEVDQRDFLDGLLRELPARQRAALVCRFYLGLSDEEIARELGVAEGSVRSAISRGLATLRTKTSAHDVRTYLR